MVSYLLTSNLALLNKGIEPTFVSSRYQTIIDLTLASQHISDQVKNWHVSDEPSLSDHRHLCYEINLTVTQHVPRRNPRKTNKTKFKKLLANKVELQTKQEITNTATINENVETITKHLIWSYEQACPLKTFNTKQVPKHNWWGHDLERGRKRLRQLFNRAKNTRREIDWDNFKEAQSLYNKQVKEKQDNCWHKFCTNIESNDNAARIRKILADDNSHALGSLKRPDGTYTKDDREISELLIETHFPGCKIVNSPEWAVNIDRHPDVEDWDLANRVVTSDRIHWAINTFHPFKSGGTDNIFPALLQWGIDQITPWLVTIYKACIAHRYIPITWREVKVVFLPKPGRCDYTIPKSFRPISLTSFLLKTLERLGDRFLRDGALKDLPLHINQHAYTAGKSTESALHSVVAKIEHDLENKLSTLGTFIDIEGAFDKTTFGSIDNALERYNVPRTLRSWIGELLKQRVIQLDINGITKGIAARGPTRGCLVTNPMESGSRRPNNKTKQKRFPNHRLRR